MPAIHEIADLETYVADVGVCRAERLEIAPGIHSVSHPPRFVLGPVSNEVALAMLGELTVPPVSCFKLANFGVGPDGIILDGAIGLSSGLYNLPSYHAAELIRRDLAKGMERTRRHVAGTVVHLCGPGFHVYGHWLVDFLPRLLAVHRLGFDLSRIKFLVASPVSGFVEPLLNAFGISPDQLITFDNSSEIVDIETLLLPSNMRHGMRLHPLMSVARSMLLNRAGSRDRTILEQLAGYERVFVSRRGSDQSRVVTNRGRIESIATHHGFRVVAPETMTFADQLRLLGNVRQIAGEYGSGLHGVLFAPAGTVTCALRGGSVHPGFIQTSLGNVCDQTTGYVLSSGENHLIDQTFEISEVNWEIAIQCMQAISEENLALFSHENDLDK